MDKEILIQYADLQREAKEVRNKIRQLENEIKKLEAEINSMTPDRSIVKGGYGGNQLFAVEGYASLEYRERKADLLLKRLFLNQG